jgi:hypothetical protein
MSVAQAEAVLAAVSLQPAPADEDVAVGLLIAIEHGPPVLASSLPVQQALQRLAERLGTADEVSLQCRHFHLAGCALCYSVSVVHQTLSAGLCCCCLSSCRIAATRAAARRWTGAGAGGCHPQLRLPALCQPGWRGRPCCGARGRQPSVLKVPSGLVLWHRLLACRLASGASADVQGAGGSEAGGAGERRG